ncbi:MAG: DUF2064 domain-containing protein [Candidatus Dormibacteraeota bacterium]|uniref:DUF2064 domain-containing protein n=1 Tax=Candidatus Dormiibacter inghamiae TaxID=3127013 RepID=A0A934KJ70_9BACT|nr:DUF2064 domain-containing protein [Candidatus Dormibacteraeota bacterium]MBJ7606021.1 DUF2064 domain-containing protein [Candidatus Dormibacteraeota bacterium]
MPTEVLREAVARLQRCPAVLGPGPDGGYYLVGLRSGYRLESRRRAFLQAPLGALPFWPHTQVALGDPPLLPPHPDVDTRDDLDSLAVQLESDPPPRQLLPPGWTARAVSRSAPVEREGRRRILS